MANRLKGFTLVELIVSIVILAVLSTIVAVGVVKYQADARDAQRKASVTEISEALEKYYMQKGEYPSVPALTSSTAQDVAKLLNVNEASLKMPRATNDLSIVTNAPVSTDNLLYSGASTVNSDSCLTAATGGCDKYVLSYQSEAGEAITIQSRRDGSRYGTVAVAPPQPNLQVQSAGGLNVQAEASEVPCAQNSARLTGKYSFQYQIGSDAWSGWSTWQAGQTYIISASQGDIVTFKAVTRCDDGTTAGAPSPESAPVSFTVPVGAPVAPTLTVVLSGSNVTATATTTSCASGFTPQYAMRSRINNGSWSAYSSWSTTRTASQTANQGVRYGYQVQARCYSSSTTSGSSSTPEVTYTHPITAPAPPTVTVGSSNNLLSYSINGVSCPSGTSAQYQYRNSSDWGTSNNTAWTGPFSTPLQSSGYTALDGASYTYEAQGRCISSFSTSPWSVSAQATHIVPILTPGPPTQFVSSLSSDKRELRWAWTSPTCRPGTRAEMIVTWHWNEGQTGEWHPTSGQGYWGPSALFRVTDGSPLPSGLKARASARYICVNTQTGRSGAWGPEGSSPVFVIP